MPLNIEMVVDNRPGVLARVIRALKDLDHVIESNSITNHSEPGQKVLITRSNGPDHPIEDITQRMTLVTGMVTLVSIQGFSD